MASPVSVILQTEVAAAEAAAQVAALLSDTQSRLLDAQCAAEESRTELAALREGLGKGLEAALQVGVTVWVHVWLLGRWGMCNALRGQCHGVGGCA